MNRRDWHFARLGRPPKPAIERVWRLVDRQYAADCWPWLGNKNEKGYGRFSLTSRRSVYAHRFMYELMIGPIPTGLTIDHLCRNRGCVNPAHMEPVERGENTRRGGHSIQTLCKYGHPLDKVVKRGRDCRTCQKRRDAEYRARKRARLAA